MTALFACIAAIAGVFASLQTLRLEVEKTANLELSNANLRLERENKDLAQRLQTHRKDYRPKPEDFDKLHVIDGGRDG